MKFDNAKDWWNSICDSEQIDILIAYMAGIKWDDLWSAAQDDVTWLFESMRG